MRGIQSSIIGAADLVGCVDRHALAVGGEFVEVGEARARAAEVEQTPRDVEHVRLADHRQQRSDADASCDEQVARGGREAEVVARAAEPDGVAHAQARVDVLRSPASGALAQHGDREAVRVPPVAEQAVLTGGAVRKHDVDVGARRPVGQPLAVGPGERELDDILRDLPPAGDDERAPVRGVAASGCRDGSRLGHAASSAERRRCRSERDATRGEVRRVVRFR